VKIALNLNYLLYFWTINAHASCARGREFESQTDY